jgi:NADH-quinone oxidoreductase subunit A
MTDYLPILAMLVLATVFAAASFAASALLAPKRPTAAKLAPYECGIVSEHERAERFPVKFYLVAMIFIIFDIELVFLYPWAIVFRRLEIFGLVEMGIFLLAVVVAYAYLLSSGALEWGPAKRVSERLAQPVLRAGRQPPPEGRAA